MHVLVAQQSHGSFRADTPPVLRVAPGETIRFETTETPIERLFAAGDDWLGALDVRAINVVTGPVYVEGVEPGDAVAVEILAVEPGSWGWCAAIPNFGALSHRIPKPMLRRVAIQDGEIELTDRLRIPSRPMIGCLGLAPPNGESSTLAPPEAWGGNYDLTQIAPGTTVLFPAQIPGGLFSLGDLHAAMGANEITGVSIECPGAATVRLHVRKGLRLVTPRVETLTRIYTIGLQPQGRYAEARAQAANLMWDYLVNERGCAPDAAYLLCSSELDVELGGPAGMVVLAGMARAPLDTLSPPA
ncbi:MAG: acetamidase/formamidase family protein [Thermomicrobiales bacterium]|nr:acetamidase/formamidase family protein [Thermomicrobiales bacterium]